MARLMRLPIGYFYVFGYFYISYIRIDLFNVNE